MNNEFVLKVIRRSNLTLLATCILILAVLAAVTLLNARYFYNFFLGPFTLERQEILSAASPGSLLRYYVKLAGDQTVDTGYQWVSESDSGTQTVEATYSAMVLDRRLLIVKVRGANPESAEFTGALVALPEDVRTKIVADAESQVPGIGDAFLPFMLDTANFRTGGLIGLVVGAAVFFFCAWFLFVGIQRSLDPAKHPLARGLARLGPLDYVANQIEMEMQSEHPRIGATHLTKTMLIEARPTELRAARFSDIAWVYKYVVQHRHNGIPTGKTYSAIVWDRFGAKLAFNAKEKDVDAILQAVMQRTPWAIPGFHADIEKEWRTNRAGVLAAVEQRKAAVSG